MNGWQIAIAMFGFLLVACAVLMAATSLTLGIKALTEREASENGYWLLGSLLGGEISALLAKMMIGWAA